MRKSSVLFSVVAMSFGAAQIAQAVPAQAATSGESSTRSSSVAAKTPTYEQLRKSLKIDPLLTLEKVRADGASFGGRAIELSGIVTGTIGSKGAQTAMLNVEESVVRFVVTPQILNGELLTAGASVRVLAIIGQSKNNELDASSAIELQPLAVVTTPKTVWVERSAAQTPAGELEQLPSAADIPLVGSSTAKMPNIIRPNSASSTRKPTKTTSRPAISNRAPITEDDSYGTFDAQMPAYRAMVRRFNPKLTPDLVDKIALALLQAGTANGMDPRFLASIISVESDFDIYCRSSSGAMGLGQLMPFNLPEAKITNAWDPVQNVWGTARLLRGHLNDYRTRSDGTLLAVAAYNAGPGAVRRAGYRVPNGSQVQRYVWKVYNRYKEFAPDMFNKG